MSPKEEVGLCDISWVKDYDIRAAKPMARYWVWVRMLGVNAVMSKLAHNENESCERNRKQSDGEMVRIQGETSLRAQHPNKPFQEHQ